MPDRPEFVVEIGGKPRPQKAKQIGVIAGKARAFTPKQARQDQMWMRQEIQSALRAFRLLHPDESMPWDEPLEVTIVYLLPRPKSRPKRETQADRKPDLDNLDKILLDAAEQVGVFANDARIVSKQEAKGYVRPDDPRGPRTILAVRPYPHGQTDPAYALLEWIVSPLALEDKETA